MKRYDYFLRADDISKDAYEKRKKERSELGVTMVTLLPGQRNPIKGLELLIKSLVKCDW